MALADLLYGVPSQTSIGTLQLDVLLEERISLPSVATEYPVETGISITDDIIPQSRKLSISGTIETGSVAIFGGLTGAVLGKSKLQDAVQILDALYQARTPITIVTGLKVYQNYAMTACEISRAGGGSAMFMSIRADFIQINTVSTQTTTIAASYPSASTSVAKAASSTTNAGQAAGGTPNTDQQVDAGTPLQNLYNKGAGAVSSAVKALTGS